LSLIVVILFRHVLLFLTGIKLSLLDNMDSSK
jgi:hypothetical protein